MDVKESLNMVANQRAQFAYKCVKNIINENTKVAQKYKSYSKRIMSMIRVNGLLATVAFIKESISNEIDGQAYRQLYDDIGKWLRSEECPINFIYQKEKDLVDVIIYLTSDQYRIATKEIMEFINWIRRFAEGMIKDENSEPKN